MDTIKILLSITAAMLAGSLFWSYSQQNKEITNAPKDELARIEQQLASLALEEKNLENEKRLRGMGVDLLSNARTQAAKESSEQAAAAAAAAEQAKILADLENQEKLKQMKIEEDLLLDRKIVESTDKDFRNQNLINNALAMARITEFVDDAESGTFVVFDLKMPELVQVGNTLAVRRNGGIAGYVKVTSITGVEGVAEILPGLGKLIPKLGEDLIINPIQ